jgi:hypothetical protein
MRRSPTRLALVALAASSLGLAAVAPSRAAASIPVSGSVSPTGATLTPRIADGNVTLDGSGTHVPGFLDLYGHDSLRNRNGVFRFVGHRAVSGPDRRPGDDSR